MTRAVPSAARTDEREHHGEVQPAKRVDFAGAVRQSLPFRGGELLLPVTGGMPDGVFRDDPLPSHPWGPFRTDSRVFLHTLARLPAVRQLWLRRIYDQVKDHPYDCPF